MARSPAPRDRPITSAELDTVLDVAGDAVLIGGQALAFWLAFFSLDLPPGPRTYVSLDADFLAMHDHVRIFAQALGARAEYTNERQLSALHGAVVVTSSKGDKVLVDVLRSVVGLSADEVRKRAIRVTHPTRPNTSFLVMNPADCLVSRFENLRKLADKRNEAGAWQAAISVLVCRAYIEALIAREQEQEAVVVATRVLRLTSTAPGLQAFRIYGVDALQAIPIAAFRSPGFCEQQYPRMLKRIAVLREAYKAPPRSALKPPKAPTGR